MNRYFSEVYQSSLFRDNYFQTLIQLVWYLAMRRMTGESEFDCWWWMQVYLFHFAAISELALGSTQFSIQLVLGWGLFPGLKWPGLTFF